MVLIMASKPKVLQEPIAEGLLMNHNRMIFGFFCHDVPRFGPLKIQPNQNNLQIRTNGKKEGKMKNVLQRAIWSLQFFLEPFAQPAAFQPVNPPRTMVGNSLPIFMAGV
jgi:hypothetical protein